MIDLNTFQEHPSLYELVVADIIRLWPGGGVHVDGGAHMGHHTAGMLARDDVRRVVAIEAIPALCDRISQRFPGQARLDLVRAAVGHAPGQASFSVAVGAMGYSGLKERQIAAVQQWRTIEVQVHRIDDLVGDADRSSVGLIKLDLEGGEFDAMRGAIRTVSTARPMIVFENGLRNPAKAYGYGWDDVAAWLQAMDYEAYDFFGHRVDRAYWEATLKTYMFVAIPAHDVARQWRDTVLAPCVAERAASKRSI